MRDRLYSAIARFSGFMCPLNCSYPFYISRKTRSKLYKTTLNIFDASHYFSFLNWSSCWTKLKKKFAFCIGFGWFIAFLKTAFFMKHPLYINNNSLLFTNWKLYYRKSNNTYSSTYNYSLKVLTKCLYIFVICIYVGMHRCVYIHSTQISINQSRNRNI